MKFTKALVVGACAVAAVAASGTPAFADGGGQARARTAPPARVGIASPRVARVRPAAPMAGQTIRAYRPRLGGALHTRWAPSFARQGFGPYGHGGFSHGRGDFDYGYGGFGYGYGYPAAGFSALPAFGSVRITDAPRDAEVYVDGYYAGVVDDFDGKFQRLKVEPGPHQLEVRAAGSEPRTFDVNVQPSRTVTFRVAPRP
jgi:hypothetical protein